MTSTEDFYNKTKFWKPPTNYLKIYRLIYYFIINVLDIWFKKKADRLFTNLRLGIFVLFIGDDGWSFRNRVFPPPFYWNMASTENTGVTTGQPNLHKQDLSKLVSNCFY